MCDRHLARGGNWTFKLNSARPIGHWVAICLFTLPWTQYINIPIHQYTVHLLYIHIIFLIDFRPVGGMQDLSHIHKTWFLNGTLLRTLPSDVKFISDSDSAWQGWGKLTKWINREIKWFLSITSKVSIDIKAFLIHDGTDTSHVGKCIFTSLLFLLVYCYFF